MIINQRKLIRQDAKILNGSTGSSKNGIILMYHRVTRLESDPWSLAVAPENFTEQIRLIKRDFTPVKLTDMVEMNESENLSRPLIALTFDDGYRDNYLNACRILNEYDVPATFYLVSNYLGSKRGYWWDKLQELMFIPETLPPFSEIHIKCPIRETLWDSARTFSPVDAQTHQRWLWEDADPTPRHSLFRKLYIWLRDQPERKRIRFMDTLCISFGRPPLSTENNQLLSLQEAQAIAANPLFEIGAHTTTHQDLKTSSPSQQKRQIFKSKKHLEKLLGFPCSTFAYTYGSFSQETIKWVRKAGFVCACTVDEGFVHPETDPFLLPRIHMKDWSGETFEKKINGIEVE